ncbi:hypothetical protein ACFUN8_33330 [Streptomyces sp. NPDC057307]|uniref:hypothetical protein n=1 Tax=Streptomyces sp. NPDC057307 TaxID=3346096 RepID=UPI003643EA4F
MAITFGLPVVLFWLILGLLPVRNPSARRLWIGIYMGISMLVLLIAYLYSADNQTSVWDESGADDQYFMLLYAAVLVGPGMLAALVRLLVSQPDPPAPPPVAQYPPPYAPPYVSQYPPPPPHPLRNYPRLQYRGPQDGPTPPSTPPPPPPSTPPPPPPTSPPTI